MLPTSEGEKQTRQRGKYTGKKSGHCKYGGWSRDGTAQFNELYNLVQEDRLCQHAKQMEMEFLAFCRKEMDLGVAQDEGVGGGGAAAMVVEQEAMPLEVAWDLDDTDHGCAAFFVTTETAILSSVFVSTNAKL